MSMFSGISTKLSAYPDNRNNKYFPKTPALGTTQYLLSSPNNTSVLSTGSYHSQRSSKIGALNQQLEQSQERRRSINNKIREAYASGLRTEPEPIKYYPSMRQSSKSADRRQQQQHQRYIQPQKLIQTNQPILTYSPTPIHFSPSHRTSPVFDNLLKAKQDSEALRAYNARVGAIKKQSIAQKPILASAKEPKVGNAKTPQPVSPLVVSQQFKTGSVIEKNIGTILVVVVAILMLIFLLR